MTERREETIAAAQRAAEAAAGEDRDRSLRTMEAVLTPVFDAMDDDRLCRFANGDFIPLPAFAPWPRDGVALLARYCWERRRGVNERRDKRLALAAAVVLALALGASVFFA